MKFFIDTANLNEIKEAAALGILDGVTTNPSLVSKEGMEFRELLGKIVEIVDGPISAEAISEDSEGMVREARELSKIHKNIVVKIPMTPEGLKAVRILGKEGVNTNMTLVFSANQAILAAIERQDAEAARAAIVDHLQSAKAEILLHFSGSWAAD